MNDRTAWTGGQYSLYRAAFGAWLLVHFAMLAPWASELFSNEGVLPDAAASPFLRLFPNVFLLDDSPGFVNAVLVIAALLSIAFAVGWRDRTAALLLWIVWGSLYGRNPLIGNPAMPYVGLLLLVHLGLPKAPYGSFSMRGRVDPSGGWWLPRSMHRVVWILMSVGYTYSGYTKLVSPSWLDGSALRRVLENPLARPGGVRLALLELPEVVLQALTFGALAFELGFVLLALVARLRPIAWLAMLSMHLLLILLIDFADLSLGMVILHLFTFDPAWVPSRRDGAATAPLELFYDGDCGLCHGAVRMVLAEDPTGETFRFAPLQGPTFAARVDERTRASLPDSLVLRTADGRLHVRSDAAGRVLLALGGWWRVFGHLLLLLPRVVRDTGYAAIASVRRRWFRKPSAACPILPAHLRARFDP